MPRNRRVHEFAVRRWSSTLEDAASSGRDRGICGGAQECALGATEDGPDGMRLESPGLRA